MDYSTFKEAVIAFCKEQGITEYELYYQTEESTAVKVFAHEVNQFTGSVEGGICFRCIVDGKMGYASTEELSLSQAHSVVLRAVDNARCLETVDAVFLGEGGQQYETLNRQLYELPTTEELVQAALQTQQKLYDADPAVIDGTTTQSLCERKEIAICNSKGLDLYYVNHIAGIVVSAMVQQGEEKASEAEAALGALPTLDTDALTAKAVAGAKKKLGGEPAPTGVYPVVFSPEAMSLMLGAFAGIFSASAAQKGLSKLADAEGTAIASEVVTIIDDPFHPENPSPIPFDAEGSPTHRKAVVEKGVLNTLFHNLKTAHKAGVVTTGNAAKAGFNGAVGVCPFTMYIAPGTVTEDALLRQAENGVYIDFVTGLHAGANGITGDFSLQSAGYLIENGKKTTRVRSFTVAGNFYDLLKNITAVSDCMILPSPVGKTTFGSPCVLVNNLSIAGK